MAITDLSFVSDALRSGQPSEFFRKGAAKLSKEDRAKRFIELIEIAETGSVTRAQLEEYERLRDLILLDEGRDEEVGRGTGDYDFSATEMARNLPHSVAAGVRSMAEIARDPLSFAESVADLAKGAYQKMTPGFTARDPNRDVSNIPMVDDFIDKYDKRAGTLQRIQRTIEQDPFGAASEASAILFPAGALTRGAGSTVKKASPLLGPGASVASTTGGLLERSGRGMTALGAATDPLNLGLNVVKGATGLLPGALPAAQRLQESAAKWSTTAPRDQRKSMTDTSLKYGIKPDSWIWEPVKGIDKLDDLVNHEIAKVTKIINKAEGSVPVQRIFDGLEAGLRRQAGFDITAPGQIKSYQKVIQEFDDYLSETLGLTRGDTVTVKQLQEFKKQAYKKINYDRSNMLGDLGRETALKDAARAAKEAIEEVVPAVKKPNEKLSALYEVMPPTARASSRIENKDLFGIGAPIKITAAESVGAAPIGIGLGLLEKGKAGLAQYLSAIKKRGVTGVFFENYIFPAMVREGLYVAGELSQARQDFLNADDVD
jgi:hypothetical protein